MGTSYHPLTLHNKSLPFLFASYWGLYHKQGGKQAKKKWDMDHSKEAPLAGNLRKCCNGGACSCRVGRKTCLSRSLCLSPYIICKIKNAVISWKQILCHTDGSFSSNGKLSHWVPLCYQLVAQTLISAPAFLPLSLHGHTRTRKHIQAKWIPWHKYIVSLNWHFNSSQTCTFHWKGGHRFCVKELQSLW